MRDLYHPAIVNIFDVFDEPRRFYIFEELCFGGTLADILQVGPFPECEVARFARNMLAALSYMHQHKVAHRTINPSNICFYQTKHEQKSGSIVQKKLGLAKFIDFGQSIDTRRPKSEWMRVEQ